MGFVADLLKNVVITHQSLKTAEIRIRTPLKLGNYFRFQTIGVEATIFLSRIQNLLKIGKDLWT